MTISSRILQANQADFSEEEIAALQTAIAGAQAPPKPKPPTYTRGGENDPFLAAEFTGTATEASWMDTVTEIVGGELADTAVRLGENPAVYGQMWTTRSQDFFGYLENVISSRNIPDSIRRANREDVEGIPAWYTETQDGINALLEHARNWWKIEISDPRFSESWGSGRKRGGGGGSRLPTEAEIRQQFDLDALAEGVQNVWRGTLLTENSDPRGLARQYVDAVVATKGQQEIDFNTFVMTRARGQARYASIYKNKPTSMNEQQFLQPYFQAASSIAGPLEGAELAIGGAQFGATGAQFEERLRRTDAMTGSAPFINSLEGRMQSLNSVLKG